VISIEAKHFSLSLLLLLRSLFLSFLSLSMLLQLGARLSRGTQLSIGSLDRSTRAGAAPRLGIGARRSKSSCLTTSTSTSSTKMAAASSSNPSRGNVWAFDFDGVVCDSVGESAISAWEVRRRGGFFIFTFSLSLFFFLNTFSKISTSGKKKLFFQASAEFWPELFSDPSVLSRKEEILHKMRLVRPVVETGYENLVQVRCLLEDEARSEAASTSVERMLKTWSTEMLPAAMKRYGLDRSELVDKFGSYRDDWMQRDLRSWLESNSFYPGVCEAVAHARDNAEAYIVTTKQARFALALLREIGKIPFEKDRVFSQTVSGRPKSEVLAMLEQRHENNENSTSFHFVEDKLSTLEKVAADESMRKWNLYLVDWGYNTEEERERARGNERIEVVGVERFRGMIMK